MSKTTNDSITYIYIHVYKFMGDILHHLGALDDENILQIYHGTFPGDEGNGILLHECQETLLALVEHPGVVGTKVRSETNFLGPFQGYPEDV